MPKAILIKKSIGPENSIEETRIVIPTEREKALLKESTASKGVREEAYNKRIIKLTNTTKDFREEVSNKKTKKGTNIPKGVRKERIKTITKGLKEFGVSLRKIRVGDIVLEHCYIVPKIIGFVTFIITIEGGIKIKEVYLKTEKERNNKDQLNYAILCFKKASKIKEIKAIKHEINGLRKTELEFLSREEKPYRISRKSREELCLIE